MFKKKNKNRVDSNIELVILRSVNNDFELSMLKNILDEHNIPYIVRDHGAGGYMRIITGSGSMFRTDILVEKSQLEQALDLLENLI